MQNTLYYPITPSIINLFAARNTRLGEYSLERVVPLKAVNTIASGGTHEHGYYQEDITHACTDYGLNICFFRPLPTTSPLTNLLVRGLNVPRSRTSAATNPKGPCQHEAKYYRELEQMPPRHQDQHLAAIFDLAEYPGCPEIITEIAVKSGISRLRYPAENTTPGVPSKVTEQDVDQLLKALLTGPKTSRQLQKLGVPYPASTVSKAYYLGYKIRNSVVAIDGSEFRGERSNDLANLYEIVTVETAQ